MNTALKTSRDINEIKKEIDALNKQQALLLAQLEARKHSVVKNGIRESIESLPAQLGVGSMKEVITLLKRFLPKRGRKTKITDAVERQVMSLINLGKTGAEIKESTNLSLPTIQKIKAMNGRVNFRAFRHAA
jgi:hypothetical protein